MRSHSFLVLSNRNEPSNRQWVKSLDLAPATAERVPPNPLGPESFLCPGTWRMGGCRPV